MASHTADDPGPKELEKPVPEEWEALPVASWTPKGGATIPFPLATNREAGGNRLVLRARPYRKGVKIDSTGGKEKTWTLEALFSNGMQIEDFAEPGLDLTTPLYPDTMNKIIDSFDVQETGDLVVPTRGKFRCRAHTYELRESATEDRNSAAVTLVFIEDNEDTIGAGAITRPTVKGSGPTSATRAQFDSEGFGAWDGSMAEILDRVNEINGILNLPGTTLDDALAMANLFRANARKFVANFSDPNEPARGQMRDPEASRLERRLGSLMDTVAGCYRENGKTTQPKTTTAVYEQDMSIYAIAADVKQDAAALIDLNQYRIADPLNIEAGTVVRIYA